MRKLTVLSFIALIGCALVVTACRQGAEPEVKPAKYAVVFDKNVNEATGTMTSQVFTLGQTQKLKANAFSYVGYKFASWNAASDGSGTSYSDGADFTLTQENDITLYAQWEVRTDIDYTVQHWQENADDDGYTLESTDYMTGTLGAETQAVAKTYEHFTAGTVTQGTIAADGTTVVRIEYTREIVSLTFDLAGGSLDGATGTVVKSGKWGQTLVVGTPVRTGYEFVGWNTSGGTLPATYNSTATYTAQWAAVSGITITVDNSDVVVTKTQNGSVIIFTAEPCDSYAWYLDDGLIGTEQTCVVDTSTLVKGVYSFALEAQKGGKWYSYFAQIKVGE